MPTVSAQPPPFLNLFECAPQFFCNWFRLFTTHHLYLGQGTWPTTKNEGKGDDGCTGADRVGHYKQHGPIPGDVRPARPRAMQFYSAERSVQSHAPSILSTAVRDFGTAEHAEQLLRQSSAAPATAVQHCTSGSPASRSAIVSLLGAGVESLVVCSRVNEL